MLANLLCAVDFSPPSTHGLRLASWLAHELRVPLTVLHVAESHENVTEKLMDAVRTAELEGARDVTARVVLGSPAHEIAVAAAGGHDLVVVGSHGRTGVSRLVMGSVAEHVVREARCSVLVDRIPRDVSDYARPAGPPVFRHALCAIDVSVAADAVVRRALDLLPRAGGRLSLVHAAEPLEPEAPEWVAALAAQIRRERDVEVTTHFSHGHAARTLLAAIEADASIDLAVVGTHDTSGIRRMLVGSVAEKIVRHAPVPVVVARSQPNR